MKKKSISTKLFQFFFIILIIVIPAMGYIYTSYVEKFYYSEKIEDLSARAILFKEIILLNNIQNDSLYSIDYKKLGYTTSSRFTLIDSLGKVIIDSHQNPQLMDNHIDRPEIINALNNEAGTSIRYSSTLNDEMMYLAIPFIFHNEKYVIRTSVSIADLQMKINQLYLTLIIIGILILIIALILSFYFSKIIGIPLKNIDDQAKKIAKGAFNIFLPSHKILELDNLSNSMNSMAKQIDDRINTISRQKNQLSSILSGMSEAVIVLSLEGKLLMLNDASYKLFNLDCEQSIGKSIFGLIRNSQILEFFKNIISKQSFTDKEIELINLKKVLIARGAPLLDQYKDIIGAIIVFNDITRINNLENIRKEFVSNVSHELKTPVTAIKGSVETMQGIINDRDLNRFLEIIQNHTDRLNNIIDDLLLLSKIEEKDGEFKLDRQNVNLNYIFELSILDCKSFLDKKSINYKIECNSNIHIQLNPTLFQEAINNLVMNAIKYSENNSQIKIEVKDSLEFYFISVIDSGIGIPEKHHHRLFERFYRVDEGRNRDEGGTGLGLAIVKHIVHMHNGQITISSKVNQGSVFTIKLPRN